MKFAKELEEDLVPEWRVKYFNYKVGKKKVKAVSRALKQANRTPQLAGRPPLKANYSEDQLPFTHYDFTSRPGYSSTNIPNPKDAQTPGQPPSSIEGETRRAAMRQRRESKTMFALSPPLISQGQDQGSSRPQTMEDEDENENEMDDDNDDSTESESPIQPADTTQHNVTHDDASLRRKRYGSIVQTPPLYDSEEEEVVGDAQQVSVQTIESLPELSLPDPALDPSESKPPTIRQSSNKPSSPNITNQTKAMKTPTTNSEQRKPQGHHHMSGLPSLSKRLFQKKEEKKSDKDTLTRPSKVKRAFTTLTLDSPAVSSVQYEAYKDLDLKQEDFFNFLDRELQKIETFYKGKEVESEIRLNVLRGQLHEMRDRRLEDLKTIKSGGKIADAGLLDGQVPLFSSAYEQGDVKHGLRRFIDPVANVFQLPNKVGKIGKTSKVREELSSPRMANEAAANDNRDYVRKPHEKVPYRSAKRKLKLALQEFYRGLELLKSYAILNRTAFRKINKKYDKAVMARPPLRYMAEKINYAHFVQSTFVEETLVTIEDLYARYFERGSHKVAVNKLRSNLRQGDRSGVSFRNGLYIAAGLGFAVAGLADGGPDLSSPNQLLKSHVSFLLQIYAGYFLAVMLFLLFVVDCGIWTKNRINYVFIFEYDTRHTLDWRSLAELPCVFLFLNGLFLWSNFQIGEDNTLFLYWPILLVGITAIIIFFPAKILYFRARKWFIYSNWRLLLAGLYPVEFRDFFLGDMYCSETYTMSQLEVFFCLYANQWNNTAQCTSNQSRLLGFLTTLPAIWRAFQCLRRYYDSRNWFPHLANFAKYLCNILYYMSLSLYRIHRDRQMKAVFISFAVVNGLYCAFWDVFMDFSLGNPWSKNFLLRDNLAFRRKRYYYAVMIFDFVLRQQWIFYAIFTEDLQHSAVLSFAVAVAEAIRRGVWSLFRVENEHCNNVVQFRASRDIPLPYSVPESRRTSLDYTRSTEPQPTSPTTSPAKPKPKAQVDGQSATTTGTDIERATTSSSTVRRFGQSTPGLQALRRVGTVIATAHSQDFQKKNRSQVTGTSEEMLQVHSSDEDTDDEEVRDEHGQFIYEATTANGAPGIRQRRARRTDQDPPTSATPADAGGSKRDQAPPERQERGTDANADANADAIEEIGDPTRRR